MRIEMKNTLTIAGSDCSGGAGIQADLKTFSAHGTFGMSVITAITVQNTVGVNAVQNVDADIVKGQIDAIFSDIEVDAVKIGMVSQVEIIKTIAERMRFYQPKILVVDPVMVSKSGYQLLEPLAREALMTELLPLADLITPNLPEVEVLLQKKAINNKHEMMQAVESLRKLGMKHILIKGGHLEDSADDLLYDGEYHWLVGEKINTKNTHGTGCTLSSAITANMANGDELYTAVKKAKLYVTEGIRYSLSIGKGHGPLHHFVDFHKKAGWL